MTVPLPGAPMSNGSGGPRFRTPDCGYFSGECWIPVPLAPPTVSGHFTGLTVDEMNELMLWPRATRVMSSSTAWESVTVHIT